MADDEENQIADYALLYWLFFGLLGGTYQIESDEDDDSDEKSDESFCDIDDSFDDS